MKYLKPRFGNVVEKDALIKRLQWYFCFPKGIKWPTLQGNAKTLLDKIMLQRQTTTYWLCYPVTNDRILKEIYFEWYQNVSRNSNNSY